MLKGTGNHAERKVHEPVEQDLFFLSVKYKSRGGNRPWYNTFIGNNDNAK